MQPHCTHYLRCSRLSPERGSIVDWVIETRLTSHATSENMLLWNQRLAREEWSGNFEGLHSTAPCVFEPQFFRDSMNPRNIQNNTSCLWTEGSKIYSESTFTRLASRSYCKRNWTDSKNGAGSEWSDDLRQTEALREFGARVTSTSSFTEKMVDAEKYNTSYGTRESNMSLMNQK